MRRALILAGLIVLGLPATGSATTTSSGFFTYVAVSTNAPAHRQTAKVANCPPGTVVTGGGAYSTGTSLAVEVATTAPYDDRDRNRRPEDGWKAEVNTGAGAETITSYAICAPFTGVAYVHKALKLPAQKRRGTHVSCPSAAFRVLGGGGLTSSRSTKSVLATTGTDDEGGWGASANNGTSKPKRLTVYAVCMRIPLGVNWYFEGGDDTYEPGQTSASYLCDSGDWVTGGGTGVFAGGLAGEIASTAPIDDVSDGDSAPDDGWVSYVNNETGADLPGGTILVCTGV
jgi:hypothetical protein